MKGIPKMMNAMTGALKRWFERNVIKWDVTRDTNRDLRDPSTGETKILKVLIPTVRLNPDTGEMENWDTWTQDQTFEGDVDIQGDLTFIGSVGTGDIQAVNIEATGDLTSGDDVLVGDDVVLTTGHLLVLDTDGDTYIFAETDDLIHIVTGGTERLLISNALIQFNLPFTVVGAFNVTGDIHATTDIHATGDLESGDDVIVGDDIVMGIGQRVTLDDDADSYIYAHQDDQIRFYTGGGLSFLIDNSGSAWYNGFNMQGNRINNLLAIQFDETTKPTAVAGHGILYIKASGAVQKLYFLQEDGTEKEVAFV